MTEPAVSQRERSRQTVFLIFGADSSSVYHTTRDCPAITGRVGWTGTVVTATLNPDGSQNVGRGDIAANRNPHRRRPCRRCAR